MMSLLFDDSQQVTLLKVTLQVQRMPSSRDKTYRSRGGKVLQVIDHHRADVRTSEDTLKSMEIVSTMCEGSAIVSPRNSEHR